MADYSLCKNASYPDSRRTQWWNSPHQRLPQHTSDYVTWTFIARLIWTRAVQVCHSASCKPPADASLDGRRTIHSRIFIVISIWCWEETIICALCNTCQAISCIAAVAPNHQFVFLCLIVNANPIVVRVSTHARSRDQVDSSFVRFRRQVTYQIIPQPQIRAQTAKSVFVIHPIPRERRDTIASRLYYAPFALTRHEFLLAAERYLNGSVLAVIGQQVTAKQLQNERNFYEVWRDHRLPTEWCRAFSEPQSKIPTVQSNGRVSSNCARDCLPLLQIRYLRSLNHRNKSGGLANFGHGDVTLLYQPYVIPQNSEIIDLGTSLGFI